MNDSRLEELSKRRKLLRLSYRKVLSLFLKPHADSTHIAIPVPVDLPQGTRVVSVHNEWASDGFVYVLQNDAWPEVEEGLIPPTIEVNFQSFAILRGTNAD